MGTELIQRNSASWPRYRPSTRAILAVLKAMPRFAQLNLYPSLSRSAPTYVSKLVEAHGLADGCSSAELARAAAHLVVAGVITRHLIGYRKNRSARYGLMLTPTGVKTLGFSNTSRANEGGE